MTFLAPQKFFSPVKGEDFRFAGVKEHIQVHPHTKFHGDQRFGRPKFQAPAVGVGCQSVPRSQVCLVPPTLPLSPWMSKRTSGLAVIREETHPRKQVVFFCLMPHQTRSSSWNRGCQWQIYPHPNIGEDHSFLKYRRYKHPKCYGMDGQTDRQTNRMTDGWMDTSFYNMMCRGDLETFFLPFHDR